MTTTLPYDTPTRRKFSKLAIGTMILGLLSGPLQIVWDWLFSRPLQYDGDNDVLNILSYIWQSLQYHGGNAALNILFYAVLVPVIAAALNLFAYFRIRRDPRLCGQWFAHAGILVATLSSGAMLVVYHIVSQFHGFVII